jgi:transposase-like protein
VGLRALRICPDCDDVGRTPKKGTSALKCGMRIRKGGISIQKFKCRSCGLGFSVKPEKLPALTLAVMGMPLRSIGTLMGLEPDTVRWWLNSVKPGSVTMGKIQRRLEKIDCSACVISFEELFEKRGQSYEWKGNKDWVGKALRARSKDCWPPTYGDHRLRDAARKVRGITGQRCKPFRLDKTGRVQLIKPRRR